MNSWLFTIAHGDSTLVSQIRAIAARCDCDVQLELATLRGLRLRVSFPTDKARIAFSRLVQNIETACEVQELAERLQA